MWTATKSLHHVLLLFVCGSTLFFLEITDAVKSKYACENEKLRLHCDFPDTVRIYAAKYGRMEPGKSICPHKNISDLNCEAPNVLLRMARKCANKQKCTVRADSTFFGDPCPGTYKYLDVIYGCVLETRPTTRRTNTQTTTEEITANTTMLLSSATTKPPTTQNISMQNNISETTGNITADITATHSWIRKTMTKKPTSTASSPNAPKDPKAKASGSIGEEGVILSLMRSLYLTYRVIKDNPRDTLIVFLSVIAGGTIAMLALLFAIYVGKSIRKKRKLAIKRQKTNEAEEGNKIKSVTIELQGNDDETKEINVNPGDIIIIDHNDANQSGSEDLGYLSEIVRFYNSQNIGSDDQISIRKHFSPCDSPSVTSTTESRDSKYDSSGIRIKQCTCQQGPLLRPSSPLALM